MEHSVGTRGNGIVMSCFYVMQLTHDIFACIHICGSKGFLLSTYRTSAAENKASYVGMHTYSTVVEIHYCNPCITALVPRYIYIYMCVGHTLGMWYNYIVILGSNWSL